MGDIHHIHTDIHTDMLGQRRHGLGITIGIGIGIGLGFRVRIRIRIRIRIEWNGVGLADDANVGKER